MSKSIQNSKEKHVVPLVAGVIAGATSTMALFPLDLVKIRLQVSEGDLADMSHLHKGRLSSLQVFRTVLRHEGVAGLYQGLVPAVFGSAISWGGYFFLYEGMKNTYGQYKNPSNYSTLHHFNALEYFCMSCLSGAVLVGITNPIWLIKTRMQLQMKRFAKEQHSATKPYESMVDAARTIVREEGIAALYKGAVPALFLTSHGGVQFVTYEYLKKYFHNTTAVRDRSLSISDRVWYSMGYLTIGAVSKVIASTTTYPLQVIKSRLQQRSESLEITSSGKVKLVQRSYLGVFHAVEKIWQQEGLWGFFKGSIPNAMRVAPGAAITFVVYETILDLYYSK